MAGATSPPVLPFIYRVYGEGGPDSDDSSIEPPFVVAGALERGVLQPRRERRLAHVDPVPLLGNRRHYLRLDSNEVEVTTPWLTDAADDEDTAVPAGLLHLDEVLQLPQVRTSIAAICRCLRCSVL